jgi:pseudouridine-5'-phosphate glycosidase
VIRAGLALSLGSGFVFGVPIPPAYQAAAGPVQRAIDTALEEVLPRHPELHKAFHAPMPSSPARRSAKRGPARGQVVTKRIIGSEVTPFLLQRVQELSGGVSLSANIALIKHNALVGSQIAVALTTPSPQDTAPCTSRSRSNQAT